MAAHPAVTATLGEELDRVEILTVGIDVGSSTSHLIFSRVYLQRLANDLSSRYVVVERKVLSRSPVVLTPYRPDGLIDAAALGEVVSEAYAAAGLEPAAVDSGAVILTGEALRRRNARAIADELAANSGAFVCASAGHHLEAILAAHGSGAVAASLTSGPTLHVDVGGGTTKLALVDGGRVGATAAVAVGGRLIAYDDNRRVTRLETTIAPLLRRLGLRLETGDVLAEGDELRIAGALADVLDEALAGNFDAPAVEQLLLTPPLPPVPRSSPITMSGGVSEYVAGRETRHFGDLAPALAAAIRERLERAGRSVAVADTAIRATVTGASQFSVQVSGNTIGADEQLLPLRNLPIVAPSLPSGEVIDAGEVAAAVADSVKRREAGLEGAAFPGLGLSWTGDPSFPRLHAVAAGVLQVWQDAGGDQPLVVVFDRDVAASFARIVRSLPGAPHGVVVLDGLQLGELDYIDIGTVIEPAGVVPVVVKSLLFSA